MSWSRNEVSHLIEEYQQYECLYAVKNKLYHNKAARNSALENVQKVLLNINCNVSVAEIKSKFNALRTNFLSEHRKYKTSIHSGMSQDEVYKPSLWYYDKMLFLLDHTHIRKSQDSISMNDEAAVIQDTIASGVLEDVDEIFMEERQEPGSISCGSNVVDGVTGPQYNIREARDNLQITSTPSTSKQRIGNKNKKKSTADEDVLKDIGGAIQLLTSSLGKEQSNQNELGVESAFGQFIANELQKIKDEEILCECKRSITNIIFDALRADREKCRSENK